MGEMKDLDMTLSLIVDKLDKILGIVSEGARVKIEYKDQHYAEARKKETPKDIAIACKFCHGAVWDNRTTKKNPKAPDYRCKNKDCNYVAWIKPSGECSWKKSTL